MPIEVEVTAELVKAKIVDETSDVDPDILEVLLAVPIIRCASNAREHDVLSGRNGRLTAALRDHDKDLMLRPGSELPEAVGLAAMNLCMGENRPWRTCNACVRWHCLLSKQPIGRTCMLFPDGRFKLPYRDFVEESIPTEISLLQVFSLPYGSCQDLMISCHRVLYELPRGNHH